MKNTPLLLSLLIATLSILSSCHPKDVDATVSVWTLKTDILLEDKVLLGAHATDKRLVVVTTNGFLQMDAADTSFIQYNSTGGGSSVRFGTLSNVQAPSLFPPLLSNTLCVSVHYGQTVLYLADIASTRDSTAVVQQRTKAQTNYPILYVGKLPGLPNAQVDAYPVARLYNNAFAVFNESTRTLLYRVFDNPYSYGSGHMVIVNQNETGYYFANTATSDPYRTEVVAAFSPKSCIAYNDYFLVTPDTSHRPNAGTLLAIDAKRPLAPGSIRKIPISIDAPDVFFLFKNHIYSHSYQNGQFARSTDGGMTWQVLGKLPNYLKFSNIGDNLIAYAYGQILWLDDGSETFTNIRELANTGLNTSLITGVAGFKDKVYISTLSGLYSKPLSSFFTIRAQ